MAGPRPSQLGDQWRPASPPRVPSPSPRPYTSRRRDRSPSPKPSRRHRSPSHSPRPHTHRSSDITAHVRPHSRDTSRTRVPPRRRSRSTSVHRTSHLHRSSRPRDLLLDRSVTPPRRRKRSISAHRRHRSRSPTPLEDDRRRHQSRRSRSREGRISPGRPDLFSSRDFRDERERRRRSPDSYEPSSAHQSSRALLSASTYRPGEGDLPKRARSGERHSRPSRRSPSPQPRSKRYSPSPEVRHRSSRHAADSSRREIDRPSHSSRHHRHSPSPTRHPTETSSRRVRESRKHRRGSDYDSQSPPRHRAKHSRATPEADEPIMRPSYPPHSSRPAGARPPHIETSGYGAAPYAWSQASPSGHSPYGSARGSWPAPSPYASQQASPMHPYPPVPPPPQYRHGSYPPPVISPPPPPQYFSPPPPPQPPYSSSPHSQPTYASQAYRGSQPPPPPAYSSTDRRPSAESPHRTSSTRGRGTYSNLSWTPQTGNRGGKIVPPRGTRDTSQTLASSEATPPASAHPNDDEDDNPFRPSKDLQVEDESTKAENGKEPKAIATAEPPAPAKDTKISFALKSKAPAPSVHALQPTDLSQKMREPLVVKPKETLRRPRSPRYDSVDDRGYDLRDDRRYESRSERYHDPRLDHRYDVRDERRYDSRDERRYDPRDDRRYDSREDYRESYRYDERRYDERKYDDRTYDVRSERAYDPRDERGYSSRSERYLEARDERRYERRDERYYDSRPVDRGRPMPDKVVDTRSVRPEPRREVKIVKRIKPRPTLPPEFAASTSVYFRKPGNESVIGSGTYGKVFKAIHVYTKDMVALKRIRMEGERDGFPVTAIREVKLLQSLNHDNIVRLQEVMVENNDCYMVFEYLSHDLTGLLNHPTFVLSDAHKKHLARQLFEGLDYLHRRGVLHRDIKAANILISNEGQLKLADFGLARFYAKRRQLDYTNRVITIWYRSPELLLGETQYGPAVDIWSAACVLVEIFTKHAIFPGDGGEINQLDKIYAVLGTPTKAEWPGIVDMQWFELLRPTERQSSTFAEKYRDKVTPQAFELLSAMFAFDPAVRPSAADVLEHAYFTTEEPRAQRALALKALEGDWHEFESKALRKEKEKEERHSRRAAAKAEYTAREKRPGEETAEEEQPEGKRVRLDNSDDEVDGGVQASAEAADGGDLLEAEMVE